MDLKYSSLASDYTSVDHLGPPVLRRLTLAPRRPRLDRLRTVAVMGKAECDPYLHVGFECVSDM